MHICMYIYIHTCIHKQSIRQLIKFVDLLVFEQLKGRVTKLMRVAERSDAMLAVYPGVCLCVSMRSHVVACVCLCV